MIYSKLSTTLVIWESKLRNAIVISYSKLSNAIVIWCLANWVTLYHIANWRNIHMIQKIWGATWLYIYQFLSHTHVSLLRTHTHLSLSHTHTSAVTPRSSTHTTSPSAPTSIAAAATPAGFRGGVRGGSYPSSALKVINKILKRQLFNEFAMDRHYRVDFAGLMWCVLICMFCACMYVWQILLNMLLLPEIRHIEKLKFLGTRSNSSKIEIWICTAKYRGIWVS